MIDKNIPQLEADLAAASVAPVDSVKRIDALAALAWELRGGDAPRAHALANEARELAIEHGYALGQARAARTMAMTVGDSESLCAIFDLAEEAKRLFDQVGDLAGRAGSRDFLASLHEHTGDLAGGLELALDALSLARELGDPNRQAYALSNVGGILAASGELDAGIERLEEALALFQGAQNAAGAGSIASRLSKVLKSDGRLEEALTYAEMCREIAKETQDEFLLWAALGSMAEIEHERGHLDAARGLYRAALETLETQLSVSVLGAETQVALGKLLIDLGALAEAERELTDALGRVEGHPISIRVEVAAHEALAELHERQGELTRVVEHLRKAQVRRERISQQDARNKLAQIEVRAAMEAAKKDAEMQKLRLVELRNMQSKLVEAEKMALLGKLAAGTAHELNTPLGVLRNNARLAAKATERLVSALHADGEANRKATKLAAVLDSCKETTDEALTRIAAIAQSFKRFTHLDQAEFGSFELEESLESALALLEPTISQQITLERRFEPVPALEGWPRELNHAFLTVLENAAQAIDEAGVVSVETRATEAHVLVRVRDTGRGMSKEEVARLFDVDWSEDGSRTKMRLGLSAAYTTVQKHGGTMEIESTLGEGTTITFRFPIPGG